MVDKEYKTQEVTPTVTMTNVSEATVYASLSGHDIQFYIQYTLSAEMTDSTLILMTISPNSCGATAFGTRGKAWSHFSDSYNATIAYFFSTAGILSSRDCMVRGSSTASIASGSKPSDFNSILIKQTNISNMLDSFCDKFYWKRTA